MKVTRLLTPLLALAILAAGCAPASPTPGMPPGAATAISSLPRDLAPSVRPDDLAALTRGNREFALDLYQALRGEDGNLFYSPFSVSLALAMTYAGARGTTEQQMADVLHFDLPQGQLHPAFNALELALTRDAYGAGQEGEFQLNLANALWAQNDYPLKPDYLDTLAVNYGAGLNTVNFMDEATREQARQAINQWVSDETQGKIEELIEQGVLTQDTRLVLANAIYFNAEWEQPFLSGTEDEPFTLLDGSTVIVPLMSRRSLTGHAEGTAGGAAYEAVEIDYKGGRMRMLVLVPAAGQFEAFEAALNADLFDEITAALEPTDVKLYLPRFSYDASLALADTLQGLGMTDAFARDRADFSGMVDIPPRLVLSHVIHKAFVAVDELGTEAAAATGVVEEIVSMPQEVRVDRPFIYAIRDAETGAVLFVGRVVNPG